jgi:hypothetical protein
MQMSVSGVRREKAALSSGCKAHPANSASNRIAKWYQNAIIALPPSALDRICDIPTVRLPSEGRPRKASTDPTRRRASRRPLPRFAADSALEGTGFEPSVPFDTAEVSRAAHIASA